MLELIKQNVLYPLAGRLGSSVAGGVLALGVSQQHADWLALGVIGAAGVVFDLGASWVGRRHVIDRTFKEVIDGLFPDNNKPLPPEVTEYDFRNVGGGQ